MATAAQNKMSVRRRELCACMFACRHVPAADLAAVDWAEEAGLAAADLEAAEQMEERRECTCQQVIQAL